MRLMVSGSAVEWNKDFALHFSNDHVGSISLQPSEWLWKPPDLMQCAYLIDWGCLSLRSSENE